MKIQFFFWNTAKTSSNLSNAMPLTPSVSAFLIHFPVFQYLLRIWVVNMWKWNESTVQAWLRPMWESNGIRSIMSIIPDFDSFSL